MNYLATALSLKIASSTELTRRAYRHLGNLRNARAATNTRIPRKYFFRSEKYLELLRAHDVLRPGLQALEIGTGWVHWEALMLRLEMPAEVMLYDVWDNRSWDRFRAFARQLADPGIRTSLGLTNPDAGALIDRVAAAGSLDEAYALLGFSYTVDPDGLLGGIPDASRDLIISSDVGEHMQRQDIGQIVARTSEILRPGGWAYHQVVLADHLRIYAPRAHPKQYLRYSTSVFDRYFNNRVQYINCVQIPEWLAHFENAGFEVAAVERIGTCEMNGFPVHRDYAALSDEDLGCTVVQFLLRKP